MDHLREADDGVQRRAQFVAHIGEEFGLRAVGRFGALQRLLRLRLRSGERLDEVVLVMAQDEHVARRRVDLARHEGHVGHEDERHGGDAVEQHAAGQKRKQNDRGAVDRVTVDGQRPARAHERRIARERAAQKQEDEEIVLVVARAPEHQAERRPRRREEQVGEAGDRHPRPAAEVVQRPLGKLKRHDAERHAADHDEREPQREQRQRNPFRKHHAHDGREQRHGHDVGLQIAQRQAQLFERKPVVAPIRHVPALSRDPRPTSVGYRCFPVPERTVAGSG